MFNLMLLVFKVGLLHDKDENCLLVRGRSFCSKVVPGEEMILDPVTGMICSFKYVNYI